MGRHNKMNGPSQRQLRAGELLRHSLAEILQREDLRDPILSGVSITVSEVRPAPDLRSATVFCAPLGLSLGGEAHDIMKALNKQAPRLRGLLGRKIEMKFTPALTFKLDGALEQVDKIESLLNSPQVRRDLEQDGD